MSLKIIDYQACRTGYIVAQDRYWYEVEWHDCIITYISRIEIARSFVRGSTDKRYEVIEK